MTAVHTEPAMIVARADALNAIRPCDMTTSRESWRIRDAR